MGEPPDAKMATFSLPPGCRFHPSEEQLLCYYLTHKNNDDRRFGFDVINDVDLYNYDPFDLPETACFRFGRGGRKRHWYCYVNAAAMVLKGRRRRRAGGGYWQSRGQVRDVVGGAAGNVVIGKRKSFAFYLGDSPKTAVTTDWVMYEYALIDHEATFILCRVFVKSRSQNNVSDHAVSSCWQESIAAVRHIGIQHDGAISSAIGEAIVPNDNFVDEKNEALRFQMGLVGDLDGQTTGGAVAPCVRCPLNILPNELVRASGLKHGPATSVDNLGAHHLMGIVEEDFIELDDLAYPLPEFNFT
ncbi:hypothetical protein NMG60_11016458 [Bertholletia excelsa]